MTYLLVLYKFSLNFFEQPIVLALYHEVTWEAEEKETKSPDFLRVFVLLRNQDLEILEKPSHKRLFWNLELRYRRIIYKRTQTNDEGLVI